MAIPVGALIGGLAQVAGGIIGSGKRKREAQAAQAQFDQAQANFAGQTFTNQFSGLENPFEDLTVNQQASQFQAQQTDQALAQALDAAALTGGSGGAQAIADAALRAKQGISADLAKQEQANAMMAAKAQAQMDFQAAQAADDIQLRNYTRSQQMLNLSSGRLEAANAARAQATQAIIGGIGTMAAPGKAAAPGGGGDSSKLDSLLALLGG